MYRALLAIVSISLVLSIAGCGQASSAPSPANTQAPAAPAAAAPAQSAPAQSAPATTSAAAPSASSGGAAPAPVPAGAARYVLAQDGTEARYRVREQLASRNFPSDAIGAPKAVTGQLTLTSSGTVLPDQSQIVVDLTTLRSDESRRDGFIQRATLQTSQYPTAVFTPTQISGLPSPLPTSGDYQFQLAGNMTIHGVTRPSPGRSRRTLRAKKPPARPRPPLRLKISA